MEQKTPLELYEENESLVPAFMARYFKHIRFDEDYLQIARIGLWKACEKFDPTRGMQFSTLAYTIMRNLVIKEIRRNQSKASKMVVTSLEASMELTGHDPSGVCTEDSMIEKIDTEMLLEGCTEMEKDILISLTAGEQPKSIGDRYGITGKRVKEIAEETKEWIRCQFPDGYDIDQIRKKE